MRPNSSGRIGGPIVVLEKEIPVQVAVPIVVARRMERTWLTPEQTGMPEARREAPWNRRPRAGDRVADPIGTQADQKKARGDKLEDQSPVKRVALDRRRQKSPARSAPRTRSTSASDRRARDTNTDREYQEREQAAGPGRDEPC